MMKLRERERERDRQTDGKQSDLVMPTNRKIFF